MSGAEFFRCTGVDLIRGGRPILSDVDLVADVGQRWAFLGPNGAGKTTLLAMAAAELFPSSGTVDVLGQRLGRVDVRDLRRLIGHVNPRHEVISPLTLADVVLTGATGTTALIPRWKPNRATIARVDELIARMGLEARRETPWRVLSQGERARTLIARALVPEPELLLFDEPTSGLDVAAREQFLATVDDLHQASPTLSTVLVTHHLEELPRSTTHALFLRAGEVLAAGPADLVLTSELVTRCFDYPIDIERRHGRWLARAR